MFIAAQMPSQPPTLFVIATHLSEQGGCWLFAKTLLTVRRFHPFVANPILVADNDSAPGSVAAVLAAVRLRNVHVQRRVPSLALASAWEAADAFLQSRHRAVRHVARVVTLQHSTALHQPVPVHDGECVGLALAGSYAAAPTPSAAKKRLWMRRSVAAAWARGVISHMAVAKRIHWEPALHFATAIVAGDRGWGRLRALGLWGPRLSSAGSAFRDRNWSRTSRGGGFEMVAGFVLAHLNGANNATRCVAQLRHSILLKQHDLGHLLNESAAPAATC